MWTCSSLPHTIPGYRIPWPMHCSREWKATTGSRPVRQTNTLMYTRHFYWMHLIVGKNKNLNAMQCVLCDARCSAVYFVAEHTHTHTKYGSSIIHMSACHTSYFQRNPCMESEPQTHAEKIVSTRGWRIFVRIVANYAITFWRLELKNGIRWIEIMDSIRSASLSLLMISLFSNIYLDNSPLPRDGGSDLFSKHQFQLGTRQFNTLTATERRVAHSIG